MRRFVVAWFLVIASFVIATTAYAEEQKTHSESYTNYSSSYSGKVINLPKVSSIVSATSTNGTVTVTNVDIQNQRITVSGSGASSTGNYTPSTSCSTSIGPQSSSSFPSSTYCSSGGMSGSVSSSGSPSSSTSTQTFSPKSISTTCSNTQSVSYNAQGKGSVSFSGSCPDSYPYSDGDGYSGTASRTGTSPSSGCSDTGTPNGSCSTTFTAYYSGTATKSSITVTTYTQSYSGTVYGGTEYYYAGTLTIVYKTNETPRISISNPGTIYRSKQTGYREFEITGRVWDTERDNVTVSLTINGKTKTATVTNPPATNTAGQGTFSLKWDMSTDNIAAGTYTGSGLPYVITDAKSVNSSGNSVGTLVADYTAPTYVSVNMVSNNPLGNTRGKLGSIITATAVMSEPMMGLPPTIAIGGSPSTITHNPNTTFTGRLTVGASTPEGLLTLTIAGARDLAGNPAPTRTHSNYDISLYVDRTPPTASIGVTTNSANRPYVFDGDVLTYTITPNEALSVNPSLSIFTPAKNLTVTKPGSYRGTYTVLASDPEERVPPRVVLTDAYGNTSTYTNTTDGTFVEISRTPPNVTNVKVNTNNVQDLNFTKNGDTVTVTFDLDKPTLTVPLVKIGRASVSATHLGSNKYRAQRVLSGETDGKLDFAITNISSSGKITPTVLGAETPLPTVDNTPPVIRYLGATNVTDPSSSNIAVGDRVRLSITTSEPLGMSPMITFGRETAKALTLDSSRYARPLEIIVSAVNASGKAPIAASNVVDRAGNAAVVVSDYIAAQHLIYGRQVPIATAVEISTNPSGGNVGPGNKVNLRVVFNRAVNNQIEVDMGGTVLLMTRVSSTEYRAEKTVTVNDIPGRMPFRISGIEATTGAIAPDITSTTNGSYATIVINRPTISSRSFNTNNSSNAARAIIGNRINAVFSFSQPLRDFPSVKIGGVPAIAERVGAGNSYWFYTIVTPEMKEGFQTIEVSNIYNVSGVQGTGASYVSNVNIDTTPPSVVGNVGVSTTSMVGRVTATFTVSEQLNALPQVTMGGYPATVTLSGNNVTARIMETEQVKALRDLEIQISGLVDLAGNVGSPVTVTRSARTDTVSSGSKVIISVTGVTNGATYSKSVIPVFSASSLESDEITLLATLNGQLISSGRPVYAGTHTLYIYASDDKFNSANRTITFTVTE